MCTYSGAPRFPIPSLYHYCHRHEPKSETAWRWTAESNSRRHSKLLSGKRHSHLWLRCDMHGLNRRKCQIRPDRYYNNPKQICAPLKRKAWYGPRGLWPFMFDVALVLVMAPRRAEFCLEWWGNGRGGGRDYRTALVNHWQAVRYGRWWGWQREGKTAG
jgi:hypothetical protein